MQGCAALISMLPGKTIFSHVNDCVNKPKIQTELKKTLVLSMKIFKEKSPF